MKLKNVYVVIFRPNHDPIAVYDTADDAVKCILQKSPTVHRVASKETDKWADMLRDGQMAGHGHYQAIRRELNKGPV